ncbi:NUDIX hydrolase [Pseudonocardia sp. HH130630-07]|uniref:NUDIX hydrolase n=1 Tax=Pseudonocardia sp. HH130630-07 TaxID=1690815 RepID=UPI000814BF1D|nr:NUDIX domain-containing protein [Pseudonocardia sp. HH130630-07]ANY10116.1 NUDIX hydrolase [Pseudonocardia sp. HH130630-07]
MLDRGSGDGWVHCARGHRHWGLFGAAGLLVRHRGAGDPPGVDRILLQHRAGWSHHGGTWGIPGGARDRGESAREAALREAGEESALDVSALTPDRGTGEYVDDHGGWSYTTVVVRAGWPGAAPPVEVRGAESTELRWVRTDRLDELDLHPGFAASWPAVSGLRAET